MTQPITTAPKLRDSNMELFRILSMFLVLVVHADFFSLGSPKPIEIETNPIPSFTRILIESIAIPCVNMFVLLSGWYGIRPKFKSFCNLIFQCAFFLLGLYAFFIIFKHKELNWEGIKGCFLLLKWDWFIRAYILLYILAPVINAFIDSSTERQHRNILIYFFIFQTIFSWLSEASVFFEHGYSTISFIGLYMLARYFAKYKYFDYLKKSHCLFIFLFCTLLMAFAYFFFRGNDNDYWASIIFQYDNCFVILSALSLLAFFQKIKMNSNKIINWIGASSFAVILLHMNSNIIKAYFCPTVKSIYNHHDGIPCLFIIFLFLIAIYLLAIMIDSVRKKIWNKLISSHI